MWPYIIAGVLGLAIIGGGYLFLSNEHSKLLGQIEAKNKVIEQRDQEIAGKMIDLSNLQNAYDSYKAQLERNKIDLATYQQTINRLNDRDKKSLASVSELIKKLKSFKNRDDAELFKYNQYLACVNSEKRGSECLSILQ